MKRLGMLFGFVAILAASGCSGNDNGGGGGNGGGGNPSVQGNYYTQFWNDHTNFFGDDYGFGSAGVIPTDVFAEDGGVTFSGIGLSIEDGEVSGDVVTWTYATEATTFVYEVDFSRLDFQAGGLDKSGSVAWDTTTREGGGLTITYNTVMCDDGTPCYFHYNVHGPRVSGDQENPKIGMSESAAAMTTEDLVALVPEQLGPKNKRSLEKLQEKFRERFGTAWQQR